MVIKMLAGTAGVFTVAMVSACSAHADPPTFPDISNYTAVNSSDYAIETTTPGHPGIGTYFLTPDGIVCGFSPGETVGCTGNNFPNVPPQEWKPEAGITGVNSIDTVSGLSATNAPISMDGTVHGHPVKTLPPFHSITVDGITCGVDDEKTTACRDAQGRGFILSPAWSGKLKP